MSLDRAILQGREWRRPYRRSQAVDRSCRPGGRCPWCRGSRCFDWRERATRSDLAAWQRGEREPAQG